MVEGAPYFHELAKQILDATRDAVFVAHNVNFDFNDSIVKQKDNRDVRRIISSYMKNNPI